MSRIAALVLLSSIAALAACGGAPPTRTYQLEGRMLPADSDERTLPLPHMHTLPNEPACN